MKVAAIALIASACSSSSDVTKENRAAAPMLAAARYLGADVKRFERKFENGFQIVPKDLESLVTRHASPAQRCNPLVPVRTSLVLPSPISHPPQHVVQCPCF